MTRRQLLANMDSRELTLWTKYLEADEAEREFRRQEAQKEAELKRWVNEA